MSAKTKAQLLAEIEAMKKRLAELQTVKAEPHQKNEIYNKQAHALGERVKELNCLFGISSLEETPGISLTEILQGSAELLPPAWQYPQITCARVTLDNQEYKTKNFRETKWKLASGIKVEGKRAGVVEVFYLEKKPKSDQDSFLKEERVLINAVAERLGRIIHRVGAQERVEHLTLVLRAIRNVNQLIIREKNRDVLIREVCDTLIETRGYSTAWIMLLDERGKYLDSAESGLGKGFTLLLKELKCGDFPACVQLAQGQPSPTVITDPSSTCADCPITENYSDKGWMTVRMEHAEKVYGVLSVSFGVNITFNKEELSLFKEAAGDIAFALFNIELEANREQALKELKHSEQFISDVFNAIQDGVSVLNTELTITGTNKWMEDMYSDKMPLTGKKCYQVYQDRKSICPWCPSKRTLEDGKQHLAVVPYPNEENPTGWIDLSSFPLIDTNGKITGVIEYVKDITEQVRAQQKLQESAEYQKTIFETTSLATIIIEEDTTLSMVNKQFERLSGYSKKELEGKKSWTEFVAAEDLERMKDHHQQRRIDPDTTNKQYEFQFINKKGITRNIFLNVDLIPGTKRSVASLLDITKRKQSEQEIEMLLALSRQAGAETSLEDLLFFIVNQIVKIIPPAEAASIFFYNKEREVIQVRAWSGFKDSEIKGLELEVDDSQAGCIFRTKKPDLIKDVSKAPDFKPIDKPSLSRVKSQIAVPLINKKHVVGIVFADNLTKTDAFSQENLDFLESIGNQLAGVIENARLLDQVREKEEQYHSVAEDSPGLICRFLPDGTITYVNQEHCRFFGKTYNEMIGTNVQLTIPEEIREKVMLRITSLSPESPTGTSENVNIKHDGELRLMRWTNRAIFNDKGQVISYQSFSQDITESRRTEDKLRQEQEKAQKYLDIAEVMIVAINKEGKITLVNQKGASILGYQIEELIEKNWFDTCLPERHRKEVKQVFKKIMSGEDELVEYYENPVLTKSGEERIIAWHNTVLLDEKGNNIGTLGSGEDITNRVHAEKEIMSLSKFPDENPNPVLRFSKEGKILYSSRSSAVLLNKWGSSVGKNVPPNWKKKISESFTSGENLEIEEFCEGRTLSFILSPIKEMDYVNAYGRDITKRRRAEQLLDALNRAAVAMGVAQTHQDIFDAVSEELKQIDISCMLFPVDETQNKIVTAYLSYESKALKAAEKLVGISHENFSFPIDVVDVFREVVKEKRPFFSDNSGQNMVKISPKLAKKLTTQIIKLLHLRKSISAPLIVKDQVIGVFSIQSDILTREDIPAATAFADQLSSAWSKIGLLWNLRKTVEGTIYTIAATVEVRDPYTAGHQKRVADLSAAIASEMHLSDEQVEGIKMAGVIHDLGKVNIPAEILSKPGKISELEYEIIKTHTQVGFDLLKEIEFPWPIAQMILQHHEMMDGSGYPQGLKGDEILLEARILVVADTVEAMSSHRPYRPALGIEKALEQIKQDKGTLLDPKVVDACLKVFKDGYKLPGD